MKPLIPGMVIGAALFAAGSMLRPEVIAPAQAQEDAAATQVEAGFAGAGFSITGAGTSGAWVLNNATGAVRLCGVTGSGGVRCLDWTE